MEDDENLTSKEKAVIDNAGIALESFADVSSRVPEIFSNLRGLHIAVHGFLGTVLSFFPPLRLLAVGIYNVWDMAVTLTTPEDSKARQAVKVGLGITSIALIVVATFVPVLAVFAFAAAYGVSLFREAMEWIHHIQEYRAVSKLLDKSPKNRAKLQAYKATLKYKIADGAAMIVLGAATLAGAVMLATPLAPVGFIILLATAALGFAAKITSLTLQKSDKELVALKKMAAIQETSEREAPDEQSTLQAQQIVKAPEHEPGAHDTSEIYQALAKDQLEHQGITPTERAISQEAVHEIEQGMRSAHFKPSEEVTSSNRSTKAKKRLARGEQEHESEREKRGPSK